MLTCQNYIEIHNYVVSVLGNIESVSREDREKKSKSDTRISKSLKEDEWNLEKKPLEFFPENFPKNFHYYPYIPFSLDGFFEVLEKVRNNFNYNNFIDVGCGIGDKCLLAKKFFNYDVTGVEYNPELSNQAQKVLSSLGIKIINTDAFDFNFSEFNVIYLYVPIRNRYLMSDLAVKILNEMEEGIYIDVAIEFYLIQLEQKIRILNVNPQWGRSVILKEDNELKWINLENF